MNGEGNNSHQEILRVADNLMNQGVPERAAIFAASMGYLRNLRNK